MDLRHSQLSCTDSAAAKNIDLAHQLIESFTWAETPEGHVYWEEQFWALLGVTAPSGPASSTNS